MYPFAYGKYFARTQSFARWTAAAALLVTLGTPAQTAPIPVDPATNQFVTSLLARMTLEEKLGQMTQVSWKDSTGHDQMTRSGAVGSYLFVTDPVEMNRLQHLAVDNSRLHIPLLFGFDVIHGYRTIFPIPLALAASWDPAVAETAQSMAAREASTAGIHWAFSPMVDIARDARWGRIMEGSGEDPWLGARMAAAQVRGLQGPLLGTPGHVMASVKHFAGYGAAVGGRDYDAADISEEQLWNVYFPPFYAAQQAGAGSFMTAYMDLNGVPAAGNRWLVHDVLRGDWGFQGMVVSDWEAVKNLTTHGFSADAQDAAVRAVNAGVDMEMTSTAYRDHLAAALKAGTVTQAAIDDAARNVLMAKYRMGLFQRPFVASTAPESPADLAVQRTAARKAAVQTAVLLRNEGSLLPLARTIKSLAVIGPLADSKVDIMGSWSLGGHPAESVTVLEGLRNKLGNSVTIRAAKGVEIARFDASIFDEQFPEPASTLHTDAERAAEFARALAAIRASDAAVLVLGENQNMSGERASRATLNLPGDQEQLLEAAVATGKPLVLVLLNGRPLDITWAAAHVPAILEAWYPGTDGGNAIADLLMGDANPGGKLPVTWPRSVGQEPLYYARSVTQNPGDSNKRYWDQPSSPLYPFGYGLSYTHFRLGHVALSSPAIRTDGTLDATITVENTGRIAGDEVVQLYIHQRAGSASRPVRELKAFTRVHLAPGESRVVHLPLKAADLAFWSPQTHRSAVEPGLFDLWVGTDSNAAEHTTFTVQP